jgi:hypothetical protein
VPQLRHHVHEQLGPEPFFVTGLNLEGLRREIFFLAYHLHWSWEELMALDTGERRAYVELLTEQIERENAQIAQGGQ